VQFALEWPVRFNAHATLIAKSWLDQAVEFSNDLMASSEVSITGGAFLQGTHFWAQLQWQCMCAYGLHGQAVAQAWVALKGKTDRQASIQSSKFSVVTD